MEEEGKKGRKARTDAQHSARERGGVQKEFQQKCSLWTTHRWFLYTMSNRNEEATRGRSSFGATFVKKQPHNSGARYHRVAT